MGEKTQREHAAGPDFKPHFDAKAGAGDGLGSM